MIKPPRITDTTLRDGSHAVQHQFTQQQVRSVVEALDRAGVPVLEVTHGDGLGGSSIQYGFSRVSEMDLIEEARKAATHSRIAALLVPGIGTRKDLREAVGRGIEIVRIATQCTGAGISQQYFSAAKELGLEAVGFLMMSHMCPPEALAEQAFLMESYGADCVYVVDSAGALLPDGAAARVRALKQALKIAVGFHAHNNLGLAVGNTLAAVDAGADQVDGCLRGLGAGAGNAPTELIAAALDKRGLNPGVDVLALLNAAEFVVAPLMSFQPLPDRDSIALGYAEVYSTFLLHAKRLGKQYSVDPLQILLELGRRKAVAGQEDSILEITLELAHHNQTTPKKVVRS